MCQCAPRLLATTACRQKGERRCVSNLFSNKMQQRRALRATSFSWMDGRKKRAEHVIASLTSITPLTPRLGGRSLVSPGGCRTAALAP